MELVEGKDLERLMASGPLPRPVIVYVIMEILRGLSHAHDLPVGAELRGIVHRDVSPHNVLLSWDGAVKISDFGIAKVKQTSEATASVLIKGKPAYMSPEQANSEALDGRSDLFAVGIILWELLVGKRLFVGEDMRATLAAVLFGEIPRVRQLQSDVPKDLERVVARLLERDLKARYATAADAIDDLRQCIDAPKSGAELLKRVLAERFPTEAPGANPSTTAGDAVEQRDGTPRRIQPWARIRQPGRRRTRLLIITGTLLAVVTGAFLIASPTGHQPLHIKVDPRVDVFYGHLTFTASPEEKKRIEDLEVLTEALVERNPGSAHDLQSNYANAVVMNCELGNLQKVNTYFAKLTDPTLRKSAIVGCKGFGFELIKPGVAPGAPEKQKTEAEHALDEYLAYGITRNAPLSPADRKDFEKAEALAEKVIEVNDGSAYDLQASYYSAVSVNCALENRPKVNTYFAKLTDPEFRQQAILFCIQWGIDLRSGSSAR
jgi:hypothetical protein